MARGRFAPSPTGDLHLGNLRTAILAWLWARRDGSEFVVRMEDLDRVTSSREHERRHLADLAAVGLDWDGEVVRQSERFDRYGAAIDALRDRGLTYACYCTRREIAEAAAAPNEPATQRYPGTCRELSETRRREHEADGRPPALRLRAGDEVVSFVDEVAGPQDGRADDVVLRRNDGVPAYNLAVVVDDAAQRVGTVVRGDDLLASTPSQVRIGQLLGVAAPAYAHVPLVLGTDGSRLAKRHGSVTLSDRAALGDSPADVVRFLVESCGLRARAGDKPHELLADLATRFDPSALGRDPLVLTKYALDASLRSPG